MELGLTKSELQKQVIAGVVEKVYGQISGHFDGTDADGEPGYTQTIENKVTQAVVERMNKIIAKKVEAIVLPLVHWNIETAMKKALADANSKIVAGLEQTCKQKLAEISAALQVNVKTR